MQFISVVMVIQWLPLTCSICTLPGEISWSLCTKSDVSSNPLIFGHLFFNNSCTTVMLGVMLFDSRFIFLRVFLLLFLVHTWLVSLPSACWIRDNRLRGATCPYIITGWTFVLALVLHSVVIYEFLSSSRNSLILAYSTASSRQRCGQGYQRGYQPWLHLRIHPGIHSSCILLETILYRGVTNPRSNINLALYARHRTRSRTLKFTW